MIVAEAGPYGKLVAEGRQNVRATLQLDSMSLTVLEADGLNVRTPLTRPGKADGRIRPPGEEDKSRLFKL